MSATMQEREVIWRSPILFWTLLSITLALLALTFQEAIAYLLDRWEQQEEYSHGYLIPVISIFLIWQKKDILEKIRFSGSWIGPGIVLCGLALFFLGELSTLFIIVQYAMLVVLFGVAVTIVGVKNIRHIWVPFALLVFMIPLPNFLFQTLSGKLQLISSELGVGIIRLFGISVFLEGNVIDLGSYKLQVVEACSGLRYLFPLVTLAFIVAYFCRIPLWKKIVLVLSAAPITIFMNSFRIGVIGVLVEYWGNSMAEGFLHDFEGWVVFMASMAVMLLEIIVLCRLTKDKRSLSDVFAIEMPNPSPENAQIEKRHLPKPFWVAVVMIVIATLLAQSVTARVEDTPDRSPLAFFPMQMGDWSGKRERMDQIYIDTLKFDDYVMANYISPKHSPINFYVAWYGTQRKGESAHSPRTCIPGGGWQISEHSEITVGGEHAQKVNRVMIELGDNKQLVYYWFQQRGRVVANEYLVKWYLFWDSITRNRSDGALIRVIAPVRPYQSVAAVDADLQQFIQTVSVDLNRFVPD